MDKYVIRSKPERKRQWKIESKEELPQDVLPEDLNSNKGAYVSKRSDVSRGDIRSFANTSETLWNGLIK